MSLERQTEQWGSELAPRAEDAGDLTRHLQQILDVAQRVFQPDLCSIMALNPITQRFILPLLLGGSLRHADRFAHVDPRPDGITDLTLREGSLFVEDVADWTHPVNPFIEAEDVRAFAALALHAEPGHRPLAVLYLDYRQPRAFSTTERQTLTRLAAQASAVLQQTWLLHRYANISAIGQEINLDLDTVEHLFEKLHQLVGDVLDNSHFFLLAIYQQQRNTLAMHVIENGRLLRETWPLQGGCGWVIKHQRSLVVRHRSAEADTLPTALIGIGQTSADVESLIFVPLMIRGVALGVLSVQHPQPNHYDAQDLRIMELLGSHVALALSNIRLFETLEVVLDAGQLLTRQFVSEGVLHELAEYIRDRAQADFVSLYPYVELSKQIDLSKRAISGTLLDPDHPAEIASPEDHMAILTVKRQKPQFAKDSRELYEKLGGDPSIRRGKFEERENIRSAAALPLHVGEEVVGALFVNFREPQRFDAPQKQLIQSLATYAAIAIANSRTFGTFKARRLDELAILRQIDIALNETQLDLKETLLAILDLVLQRIPASRAAIFLYRRKRGVLETQAIRVDPAADPALGRSIDLHVRQKRGLVWWAFEHQQAVRVENIKTDLRWRDQYISVDDSILAELDVPLIDTGKVIGIINLESTREAAFSESDAEFLTVLAGQVVLAVQNAQTYERLKQTANDRAALIEITNEITRQLDLSKVFDLILQKALELTKSSVGTLMLYDAAREQFSMAAESGVSPDQKGKGHSIYQGVVGMAARERRIINIGDVTQPPWDTIHLIYIPDIRSELAVPFYDQGQVRGVINIESTALDRYGSTAELLIQALADQATVAIQNAERYKQAQERQQRLTALHMVDQAIIAQEDNADQVMLVILEQALRLTGADSGRLSLYGLGMFRRTFSAQLHDSQAVVAVLADQGESVPDNDATDLTASQLSASLVTNQQQVIGELVLGATQPEAFGAGDREIAELLAGQAVIAVQNARTNLRLRLLDQVGRQLAQIADMDQIDEAYTTVQQIVLALHPQSQVTIRRINQIKGVMELVKLVEGHGIQPARELQIGQGLNGIVAETRAPLLIADANDSPHGELLRELSPEARSWIGTPIMFNDNYYGNMAITLREANSVLDTDQLLFVGLAQQLAITIHRLEAAEHQQATERRAQDLEAIASMGQASYELAHRLGNDLGLVPDSLKTIRRRLELHAIEDLIAARNIERIESDVGRVLELTDQLRQEFISWKDGSNNVEQTTIDVSELLEETRYAVPNMPQSIRVSIEIAPNTPPIWADHKQTSDILRNLLTNAVEAMPHGGDIVLRASPREQALVIEVADSGIGIAPEVIKQIFNMFYTTRDNGTGFGLWSARRNALANGGNLEVDSVVGVGTTFYLTLPIATGGIDPNVRPA